MILTIGMEQAKGMLSTIDVETYGKILKMGATRHIKETLNAVNQQMFKALKEREWIKRYDELTDAYQVG